MTIEELQQEVRKVYKDAWVYDVNNTARFFGTSYHLYKIKSESGDLSSFEYTKYAAWYNAYQSLKEQKKV